jgi:uncharacterized protein DUF5658
MNIAILAGAFAFGLLGQFYDAHTTERGLASGKGVEANPVAAWLLKHVSMTGLYVIKCVGLAQGLPVLGLLTLGPAYFVGMAAIVGTEGWLAAVYNAIQFKKAGIAKSILNGIFG